MTTPKKKRVRVRGPKAAAKAKERATSAVRRMYLKKNPPAPPVAPTPATLEEAAPIVAELLAVEEEPNGQRVIPGAGPRRSATDERPGDANEYVMTLRLTRKDARVMRVIAALGGYQYPATWAIETLRDAMEKELAK